MLNPVPKELPALTNRKNRMKPEVLSYSCFQTKISFFFSFIFLPNTRTLASRNKTVKQDFISPTSDGY